MGWQSLVRSKQAELRRQQRAQVRPPERTRSAARVRRELLSQHQHLGPEGFANYMEVLKSVHQDCSAPWEWNSLAFSHPPAAPTPTRLRETFAAGALEGYEPGLLDRLLGRDSKRRAELTMELESARRGDEQENVAALAEHEKAVERWAWFRELANGIIQRNERAYRGAIEHLVGFDELEELGASLTVTEARPDVVAIDCFLGNRDAMIPDRELSTGARGKTLEKAIPESRRHDIYQDHACSCAIRVAREVFALLPIDRVIVNLGAGAIDTSTGHRRRQTFLAVHFVRSKLGRLNMNAIDPSDSMANFDHRMKFKKSAGFSDVEPITADEQWVTTT